MTRATILGNPLLLGFDHFERLLDRVAKSGSDGYPPYNIEQIGDDGLRITLAVAGFRASDLDVSVEDNQLIIRGRHGEDGENEPVYIHRGIASRQFQRGFVLAEGIEVKAAALDNGLLHVDLVRPKVVPAVKRVAIRTASTDAAKPLDVAGADAA